MSGVYSLATTLEITFILPKLYLKKSIKKQVNFSNFILCFIWKTEQCFITFFSLIIPISTSQKRSFVYYKSALWKRSINTCRHLSLTFYTQQYFIKELYYLAKTWLCVNYLLSIITFRHFSLTYYSQKCILSVFYCFKFLLNMWNKHIKD